MSAASVPVVAGAMMKFLKPVALVFMKNRGKAY
jgi:hypothetical protein